jgi:peptide/nickel transport system ATP-binding protein
MQTGVVREEGPCRQVLSHPRHPYTRALIAALPDPEKRPAMQSVPA